MLLYNYAYFSACREKKSVLWEGWETLSKCMCLKLGCEFVGVCLHGGWLSRGCVKGAPVRLCVSVSVSVGVQQGGDVSLYVCIFDCAYIYRLKVRSF